MRIVLKFKHIALHEETELEDNNLLKTFFFKCTCVKLVRKKELQHLFQSCENHAI